MTALVSDRNTQAKRAEIFEFPPAPGVFIFRGSLTAIDAAGLLHPAGPVPGYRVVGRAESGTADLPRVPILNPAALPGGIVTAAAAPAIRVSRGQCFCFANSLPGPDQLTAADWGANCYAVDDQTLAKTDGGGTRPLAGVFRGVDALGAWVQI